MGVETMVVVSPVVDVDRAGRFSSATPLAIFTPLVFERTLAPLPSELVTALFVNEISAVPFPLTLNVIFRTCNDFPENPFVDPAVKAKVPLGFEIKGSSSQ